MKPRRAKPPATSALSATTEEQAFAEVLDMIQAARGRALAAVNIELVDLYWRLGQYISHKLESAAWGEAVVEALAAYIAHRQPGLMGFTRANLFRMRQFYEAYQGDEKVAPLVRQLPWTHNLIILGRAKRPKSGSSTCASLSRSAGRSVSSAARWTRHCLSAPSWIRQKCHQR